MPSTDQNKGGDDAAAGALGSRYAAVTPVAASLPPLALAFLRHLVVKTTTE